MRLPTCIFLFIACVIFLNIGTNHASASPSSASTPQVEYVFAVIDTSIKGEISAWLFCAFSSNELSEKPSRFTFRDMNPDNVKSVKVSDYLYFEQRYLRPINRIFLDNDTAEFYIRKQKQEVETLAIFLFEQPFWSMQIAFKLPTSFLEWQLSMREKYAGHDFWPRIFSASGHDLPNDILVEKINSPDKSGFNFSYYIPPHDEKLATRGILMEYYEKLSPEVNLISSIERLLKPNIHYAVTGQKLNIPIVRYFIKSSNENDSLFIKSTDGLDVDTETLTHRIGAKEIGIYYSSDGLQVSDELLQRFEFSSNPPLENLPIDFMSVENDPREQFQQLTLSPNRLDAAYRGVRIALIGLITWCVFFSIFHWGVLKGKKPFQKLIITLLAYFVYMAISTIFLFMFGFSFALGIVGMEAMMSRRAKSIPIIKLFAYGLLTSVSTAIVVYLAGV